MAAAAGARHSAGMSIARFKIGPIDTAASAHLEKSIESIPRVRTVTLQPEAEEVHVEHDDAPIREIVAAIRHEGYAPEFLGSNWKS
jgi:copper chaperone CopZ